MVHPIALDNYLQFGPLTDSVLHFPTFPWYKEKSFLKHLMPGGTCFAGSNAFNSEQTSTSIEYPWETKMSPKFN